MKEYATAALKLKNEGVEFVKNPNGIVLEMIKFGSIIYYWPGADRWWVYGTTNKRSGIHRLIAYMKRTK